MKKGQEAVPSGGKKSKMANTQASQTPHVAVCEQAVSECVHVCTYVVSTSFTYQSAMGVDTGSLRAGFCLLL